MAIRENNPNKKTPVDFDITKPDPELGHQSPSNRRIGYQSHLEIAMENDMSRLCKRLSISTQDFPKQIPSWLRELDEYIETHDRLLYSKISDHIFSSTPSESERFEVNAYTLMERVLGEYNEIQRPTEKQTKQKQIVLKFYDHVNLALKQHRMFSEQQKGIKLEVDGKIESALTKTTRELTNQLVGLVGIFTALSFIIFGSISSLDSILNALSDSESFILPALIVADAWAFCVLNLLFAFMHFVLRIINAEPNKPTPQPDRRVSFRRNSDDKPSTFQGLVQKYPLVFLANYILLSALLLLLASWAAIDTGVGSGLYNWVVSKDSWTFVLVFGAIIFTIIFLGRKLYNLYKLSDTLPKNRHHRRTP